MKHFLLLPLFAAVLLIPSCASQIDGILKEGGSAGLGIQAALEPRMTSLIRTLNATMGKGNPDLVLDGASIGRAMEESPGVRSVVLFNTGPASLVGNASINRVDEFVMHDKGAPFISYDDHLINGVPSGYMNISLNRDNMPKLIALLSNDVVDYLSALMAPVILEEDIPKNEYLSMVSSLYGKPIADEMRDAIIHATVDFPGPIKSITGGVASGARAVFKIPLIDVLVLESPISWEVIW